MRAGFTIHPVAPANTSVFRAGQDSHQAVGEAVAQCHGSWQPAERPWQAAVDSAGGHGVSRSGTTPEPTVTVQIQEDAPCVAAPWTTGRGDRCCVPENVFSICSTESVSLCFHPVQRTAPDFLKFRSTPEALRQRVQAALQAVREGVPVVLMDEL